MKASLKRAYDDEMAAARHLYRAGRLDDACRHLERAHVIAQWHVLPHVLSHWLMLKIGLARRSPSQVWGQAIRILLGALGSAVNIIPVGNTGGTNISMFKRLPISADVAKILEGK
ncbi:DUF3703 domain-containing protein [Noviherbaspirillum sp. ST9]|uniref:DUF3703 domain-containing protein n=1 Tax=Noviherbaspirillum sp. ST9 TaxID=3401606 RepID=UPI003B587D46